ncbi:MAG: acyl-CoA desaturase [Saprospiraceae bacterium]|nr:acyl-CoA desaturase [Saprospiraceae bacterium]
MRAQTVQFNTNNKPEFFREVAKRVNVHFKETRTSKKANSAMVFKTVFMCALYIIPLICIVTNLLTGVLPNMILWALMGLGMAGIGLSVMHDANHGSYSRHQRTNYVIGLIINFVGGYHINWKIQHNVLHHSFTNIEGLDDDISKVAALRLSPHQHKKSKYKYQAFYAPLLYSVLSLYWLVAKDIVQVIKYGNEDLIQAQGISIRRAVCEIFVAKSGYLILFLIIPLIFSGLLWWQTLLGFLLMHAICGQILALIFQCAHILEETDFYIPAKSGSMQNNWAIHQMNTTANFATGSTCFSWFVGGLNFQIEHHLFPHICHIHYKAISKIVKATALEYNVPYHHHPTFYGALRSHFKTLNKLGTGTI